MRRFTPENLFLVAGMAVFAVLLFKHISYPLLWQDEAETAMFASRVVEYGYPKVHGDRNVLYEFGGNIAVGVKESVDAYIGTTWGHFYCAGPGVLWAQGAPDRYAQTARVRLPFALFGALGVGLWVLALLPLYRDRPRAARLFAAAFFLCAAGSISLLLHLREARYYPLLIALVGAIACVQLRFRVYGRIRPVVYGVALATLLVVVFHVFFAAWFFLVALLGIDALVAMARVRGDRAARMRVAVVSLAPLLGSAVGVAPAIVFYETFGIAASFRNDLGMSFAGYGANLVDFLSHFWRYEFLAPALVGRFAVIGVGVVLRRRSAAPVDPASRAVSATLCAFIAGYVALTCVNPLVYERYFVVLSPAVIGLFLVDAFALMAVAERRAPKRLRAGAVATALLGVVAVTSGPRLEAVRGRITEIGTPYRGPLDFAIERIAAEHADTRDLVVATNYANHPLMYYLDSHVIVGTNLNNIVRERALVPDVVIPRRRWPRGQSELRAYLSRGRYRSETLPVRDTHFNNIPALTRSRSIPDTHRYVTPEPAERAPALTLHWLEPDP
jgi:hypothetical protein